MRWETRRKRGAFVAIELLVVVAVMAVLLGLGYSVYRGARLSARVAQAESNLKQVGTALDLFFQKYGCYPPQGANLVAVLAPYLRDLSVFENPLKEDGVQGQTINEMYIEPALQQLDSANYYITALTSADGTVAVILKTGGIVERRDGLTLPPDNPGQAADILAVTWGGYGSPPNTAGLTSPDTGDTTNPSDAEDPTDPSGTEDTTDPNAGAIGGDININPNNNDTFEFYLVKPDGTIIDRQDLHESNGTLTYTGPAVRILFKPKGNGNQNTMTLNGQVYELENKNRYLIFTLEGGSMTVHLYNSKAGSNGKAMGKWWMALNAVGAKITICTCNEIMPQNCQCGANNCTY